MGCQFGGPSLFFNREAQSDDNLYIAKI